MLVTKIASHIYKTRFNLDSNSQRQLRALLAHSFSVPKCHRERSSDAIPACSLSLRAQQRRNPCMFTVIASAAATQSLHVHCHCERSSDAIPACSLSLRAQQRRNPCMFTVIASAVATQSLHVYCHCERSSDAIPACLLSLRA